MRAEASQGDVSEFGTEKKDVPSKYAVFNESDLDLEEQYHRKLKFGPYEKQAGTKDRWCHLCDKELHDFDRVLSTAT